MTPFDVTQSVREFAAAQGFDLDPAQEAALPAVSRAVTGGHGAYLWGPPGRGKTWLADAALATVLPGEDRRTSPDADTRTSTSTSTGTSAARVGSPGSGLTKAPHVLRTHLAELQARLHAATADGAGWDVAVARVLGGVGLLVLDELDVHDSDDAWMAERLLRAVQRGGGSLLVTSNVPPEGLHDSPEQHHHAAGLIALLEQATEVLPLDGGIDHRGDAAAGQDRPGWTSGAFVHPVDDAALRRRGLVHPTASDRAVLTVGGRPLAAAVTGDGVLWLSFRTVCAGPTAAADHLELADRFRTWVLAGVPMLDGCTADARARFVTLVDVACDRDVRLVLLARAPLQETVGGLPPGSRTASRLSLLRG